MEKIALALAALAPCCLLLAICAALLRRLQPAEPYREIAICTALGLASIVLVAPWGFLERFQYRFADAPAVLGLFDAFLLAAIPEELSRLCVLRWRLGRKPRPLNGRRCLLLGAVVGLGFAALENVGYCVTTGWRTVWERSITSVPFHALAGAVVGYAVGYALTVRRLRWAFLGVAATALLHGINNYNLKMLYADGLHGDDFELPTEGIDAVLVSGWPSNIVALLVTGCLVAWLARRRPMEAVTSVSSPPA